MNKLFSIFFIIIMISATAFIAANPVDIKEVRFTDSSVRVENQNIENQNIKAQAYEPQIVQKETPKQVQKQTPVKTTVTKKTTPKTTTPKKTAAKAPAPAKKTVQKTSSKAVTPKTSVPNKAVKKAVQPVQPKAKPQVKPQPKQIAETKTPVKNPPKVRPAKTVSTPQPAKKVLTEREETIVWNQWRANVENELIRLSNIRKNASSSYPASGTHIYFNFDVDINGNISNISIRTVPADRVNNARNFYIPLIMMMNRKPILKFPEGTKRTKVTVSDGIRILQPEEKSTFANSSSYADYEKVKIKF